MCHSCISSLSHRYLNGRISIDISSQCHRWHLYRYRIGMTSSSFVSQRHLIGVCVGPSGASWGFLGPVWGLLGLLGPPGASWGCLGPPRASWGLLGPSGASWGLLGPPGGLLGPPGAVWGHLGPPGVSWGLPASSGRPAAHETVLKHIFVGMLSIFGKNP